MAAAREPTAWGRKCRTELEGREIPQGGPLPASDPERGERSAAER